MPGTFLTGLEETQLGRQWGEGKESNEFADGADDFLNACTLQICTRRSPGRMCL